MHVNILVLSKNQIEQIPSEIINCIALKRLDLSRNLIRNIPSELFELPNLRDLDLGSNKLNECSVTFTEEIGDILRSSKITHLVLSNNQFTVVSWWVLMLEDLVYLHMGANYIKCLPSELNRLGNLKGTFHNRPPFVSSTELSPSMKNQCLNHVNKFNNNLPRLLNLRATTRH